MELSAQVHPHHVEEGMRLFTAATIEANSNHKNVEVADHEKKEVRDCEQLIRQRVPIGSRIKKETLFAFLQDQSVNPAIFKKTLHVLVRRNEFEEASHGNYKRVQ